MKGIKWLALSLCLVALCSCTSVQDMLEQETADLTPPAKDSVDLTDILDYMSMPLSQYVTLGTYTGQEIRIENIELTDEQVTKAIEDIKTANGMYEKITVRPAKWGDTLVISYHYTKENGEHAAVAQNEEITLIENEDYPEEFINGLVGAACGITIPITVHNENGTSTTYSVTVSYIKGAYEEFTDAFVSEYTNGACQKADAFFAYYKEQLWNDLYYEMVYDALWEVCEKNAVVTTVPSDAVLYYMQSMEKYYRRMAVENGVSYQAVLSAFGLDEMKLAELANRYAQKDITFYAVVTDAGLEISDAQYAKTLQEYAKKHYDSYASYVGKGTGQSGQVTVEDVAAYLDAQQKNVICEICYDEMLYDYLYENNKIFMGDVPMN